MKTLSPSTILVWLVCCAASAMGQSTDMRQRTAASVPNYDLTVRLVPDRQRLEATGTVSLPAEASERRSLTFSLRNDMPSPYVEVVEPEVAAGVAQLAQIGDDKKRHVSKLWSLTPRRMFPPGKPIVLKIAYAGGPDAKGGGYSSFGPADAFAEGIGDAWYPEFAERAVGRVRYEVPAGTVVVANDTLIERRDQGATSTFEFIARVPSYLAFAAGPYIVRHRREGKVPVTLYMFHDRAQSERILEITSRTIGILQEEFGKYPFPELAVIEGSNEATMAAGFGASSHPGFFIIRSQLLDRPTVEIFEIAHELGHEWFPYVAGVGGGAEVLMVSEALAQYSAYRVVEEIEGPAAAERLRREEGNTVPLITAGMDYPLTALPEGGESGSYSLVVGKGAAVYDMLSRHMGRERFRAAMQAVTTKFAGRKIEWQPFLAEFGAAAGEDLSWFYKQWFDRTGCPRLALSWRQEGNTLHYSIVQRAPTYRLELPVQIELADGSARREGANIESEKTDFTLPMSQRVYEVRLDPHFEVLHATDKEWSEGEDLRYFTRGHTLWDFNKTPEALATFQEGLLHLPEVDKNGVEFLLRLEIGWIHDEAGELDKAEAEYERALAQPVRDATWLPRLYLNIALLAQKRGDHERARWAARNVLATEAATSKETGRSVQAREILNQK